MSDLETKLRAVMAEADEWGTVADFERSLAEQGLHVVTAADKAVLDAIRSAEAGYTDDEFASVRAVLARREAKRNA